MGLGFSKLRQCPQYPIRVALLGRGKLVSRCIARLIDKDINENIGDVLFPREIIAKCVQYIGFLIDSDILMRNEEVSLYELLCEHYKRQQIASLSSTPDITYFDLLYRSSVHGDSGQYTNRSLLQRIENRQNVLILYRTNYNHVFCIYLHKQLGKGVVTDVDRDIGLFLLRSQLVYGDHHKCPRIIELSNCSRRDYNYNMFTRSKGNIFSFGIQFRMCGNDARIYSRNLLDIMVENELCGGSSSATGFHLFKLNLVEVYQVL
eukprot:254807_1